MVKKLKYTTLAALILSLIPLMTIISGWQWQPFEIGYSSKLLFLATETLTYPWVIGTNFILFSWFFWCLRDSSNTIVLLMFMIIALFIGQIFKMALKDHFHSIRPYNAWIQLHYSTQIKSFFNKDFLDTPCKANVFIINDVQIPPWLVKHWLQATEFSFPSGHTIFSATWALVGVGLLWQNRCYCTVILVMIWVSAVMSSRLIFGMHWSKDLFASIIISWILAILTLLGLYNIKAIFVKYPGLKRKVSYLKD
ncbi:Phosphatidylglycerophosphatase B [Candidatus Erwinia haradaeae]|uniref:undecaprenyl-diphosphate phosphatase n=2 Tax=Candidatus Erwinia haradaeae TaxID=1922217 RepID=A0A451D2J8_9GAMM|nr:Phosphatidylglycerophosphatase B [Candidatus Erwinia haradaeae]